MVLVTTRMMTFYVLERPDHDISASLERPKSTTIHRGFWKRFGYLDWGDVDEPGLDDAC